jgi:hypothetical protein
LQYTSFNGATLPAGVTLDPKNGLYWITDKTMIPSISTLKERLINEFHNSVGHPDYERTYSVILCTFYWPNLRKESKSFVKICPKCQRIKPRTEKPYGSSMPLPIPTRPWDSISMDFITRLPNVDGYDAILTVVCTLSKMAYFIPCNSTVTSRQLVMVFLDNVYCLHGLPSFLIGDRVMRYTSHV